ncbi:MAG: peptidylprolyl isomerase [Gammaproteobacteria bacterium]
MNNIIVVLVTTMGTLEIELYEDDEPITVKNFVSYVESGFFE